MEWAVLGQLLASHWGCVTRTAIRPASLELTVHMSIHPVVSCSQYNQDDLVCSFQAVVVVSWVTVKMLLMPFSCGERLNNGLLIFIRNRFSILVKATSLFCEGIS